MLEALMVVAAFVCGSMPFSYWLGKLAGIGLAAVLPVVVWPLEVLALLGEVAGRLFPFGG